EEKIGIVTGIAAPTRLHVKIEGKAAHSGSTPMHMRKDALLAASEIALTVEEAALSEKKQGSVATVGMFDVSPGAMNVIPGETELKIDIRGIDVQSKQRIVENITKKIQYIERKRNLTIHKHML